MLASFGRSWKCYRDFFLLMFDHMGTQKLYLLWSPFTLLYHTKWINKCINRVFWKCEKRPFTGVFLYFLIWGICRQGHNLKAAAVNVVNVKDHKDIAVSCLIYPLGLCSAGCYTVKMLMSFCSYFILSRCQSALSCLCNYTLVKC